MKKKKKEKFIELTEWIGYGTGVITRRSALAPSHKESWESHWFKKYGNLDGFPYRELYGPSENDEICPCCGNDVPDSQIKRTKYRLYKDIIERYNEQREMYG